MPVDPQAAASTQLSYVPETLNAQTHSNALPLTPPAGITYYGGTTTETNATTGATTTTNVLKCPEGYVFDGSNALFSGLEDKNVLKYNSANNWLNLDGTPITSNPWSSGSLTCKRKYCEALGIVDSDKEYDVIIDDDTNQSHTITCNEGYVFDTTNHRTGKVKCGVIPEMSTDLSKETEVAWIADNPLLEAQCSSKSTESECKTHNIEYVISNDINQDYAAPGPGVKHLKCTWIPEINTDSSGNNSGISRPGTCKFIHRADMNKSQPICRSMYCSKKEVQNSDRVDGMTGALPGPNEGSIHGDCINFDGQILDQITNSSDCACFKHKSCDVCTKNENCQWCGYSTSSGNRGEGGFCYSRSTPLSICDTSIRTDRGGTCTHAKTGAKKPNEPSGGFTRDACETSVCVDQSYWDSTLVSGFNESPNSISAHYHTDKVTREQCELDNNRWDQNALSVAGDFCNLTNSKLDKNLDYQYYPHNFTTNATPKFKISEKICVPNSNIFTITDLNTCGRHTNKHDCAGSCQWIDNPLRDSLFKWSTGTTKNKITFQGSGDVGVSLTASNDCPIIYTDTKHPANSLDNSNNTDEITFGAQVTGDTITLEAQGKGDPVPIYNVSGAAGSLSSNAINGTNNYFTGCPMIKVERKIFDQNTCETVMSNGSISSHFLDPPHTCEGGTKYCSSTTRRKDNNQLACPTSGTNPVAGVSIPTGGCYYYENQPTRKQQAAGYGCYGDLVDYECDPPSKKVEKYNCKKSISADDRVGCEQTGYTPEPVTAGATSTIHTINDKVFNNKLFKNYITCDLNSVNNVINEKRCENIGVEYAHWGNMCTTGTGATQIKLPAKQICELVSEYTGSATGLTAGATWGKFLHNSEFKYGCFKDDGTKYDDTAICGLANSAVKAGILTGANITNSTTFTPDSTKKCIIDGSVNKTGYLTSQSGGPSENELNSMCTDSADHHVAFDFINNDTQGSQTGACIKANGVNQGDRVELSNTLCEANNKKWVVNEYNYNDINTCVNTGPSRLRNQPDIPTEWTGGEVVNDDGIHRSECSPSVMSSCNVNCNAGYGGGGEYICQYNSSGGDVCDLIDRKVVPNKQLLCDSQPACNYTNGRCVHDTNFSNDGHLEWIGSPCYKIDNTAFAHGISKLPDLDVVFPPFERVVLHLLILMLIAAPSIYIFSHYLLKYLGISVDKSLNNSFKLLNKSVDFFTEENKLFDLLFDRNMTGGEKAGIFISAIGLFVGSYFLFDYIKEYVHDGFHTASGMLGDLITKLGKVNIVVPPKNTDFTDHVGNKVNDAASHARDRIGFVFEGTGTNITEESAKLTMIVQVAVVSLVGIIIVMLFVKDPGDFRKKLEARAAN